LPAIVGGEGEPSTGPVGGDLERKKKVFVGKTEKGGRRGRQY